MNHYTAQLSTLLLEPYQNAAARLLLPPAALPRPGQYLQAHAPGDTLAVLGTQLFAAGWQPLSQDRAELSISGPLPPSWQPGTVLRVRGPLGSGFTPPSAARHLALAAAGRNAARLLPLASEQHEVAVFCDETLGELPSHIEVQPLSALPSALAWADFLALDVTEAALDDLPTLLSQPVPRKLPAQVLLTPPMPCGGLAQCGVCSIATHNKPILACSQGPVVNLTDVMPRS